MENLYELVQSYFQSADFDVRSLSKDALIAEGYDLHDAPNKRLVWVVPTMEVEIEERPHVERRLLHDFAVQSKDHPDASMWLVGNTRGTWSPKFRSELTQMGIRERAEIEFFDAPFRLEAGMGKKATSAIDTLRDPSIHHKRIPQPYTVLINGEADARGDDLFQQLRSEYEPYRRKRPCLHLVVGPAGSGKSFLFSALFHHLYDYFITRKGKQEVSPRPIPLIPDYLRQATLLRTRELLESFIQQDVAAPVKLPTFEWMIVHGYAMWLFDGLDELYAQDEYMFDYLTRLLRSPGGSAQIIMCTRESLLTSCEALASFLTAYSQSEENFEVRMYRLDDWGPSSKRAFAWLRLEGYTPLAGREDTAAVSHFVTYTESSASLKALSSLPYYCELLLDEFRRAEEGSPAEFADDFALIDHAVSSIIKREIEEKELLRPDHFQDNGFVEWLETVASDFYATGFKGVTVENVETYASVVLHHALSEEERSETITTLVKFPLFASGYEQSVIAFEHELIAEFLAGRYWLRRIAKDPERVAKELGTRNDLSDSLIGRYIAHYLREQPEAIAAVVQTLKSKWVPPDVFMNLLQLLLLAAPSRDVLRKYAIDIEVRNLTHVRFSNMDLADVSFCGCDLTHTVFDNCELKGARFEGACLVETRFMNMSEEALRDASFGDLERFESIYANKKRIADRTAAAEWVEEVTGVTGPTHEICAAALQLRQLLLKYIRPDGQGRRSKLQLSDLYTGKRLPDAPSPEECVEACVKFGYLQGPDFRSYMSRTPGDLYDDLVRFVKDWSLSADLRSMLNTICPRKGCKHIPPTLARDEGPETSMEST